MAAVGVVTLSMTAVCSFVQTPLYKATSLIEINRGKVNLGQAALVEDRLPGIMEFYPTQKRILASRTLAHRTVAELRLWDHPVFESTKTDTPSSEEETKERVTSTVRQMLEVSYLRNTQLLEVSFVTPDPVLSAELTNALVRQYMLFSSEADLGVAKNTSSFLRDQIQKLQQDIQKKEALLQEYSKSKDIVMVGQNENIVVQHLEDLNRRLADTQAERAQAEARYRSLENAAPHSIQDVLDSRTIQNMKQQLALLQKQYDELSAKFKDDWPDMIRTRNAMEELQQRIDMETNDAARKAVANARVVYQAALREERLLKDELEKQKGEAQGLNSLAADYNSVKAELDNQRVMLQQLLRRQSETGLTAELGETQPVNVRIVEEAVVPRWRFKPNIVKNLVFGAVVALFLALGLAFFLDYWDTSIYTIEDLKRDVSIPYLGMIPKMKTNGHSARGLLPAGNGPKALPGPRRVQGRQMRGRESRPLPTVRSSAGPMPVEQSIIRERFKFLRGALLLSNAGGAPKTVLVTSPHKHAGKTFVVSNLAASLAEMQKKVLLVDADLRNPHLHRVFGIRNRVGLTNVLTGQLSFQDGCILKTSVPNLFVLLAGPLSPTPAELLDSAAMQQALERTQQHFDFVLVDSAPLLPVIDTHVLTSRCDAVVLVTRSGQTTRPAVKQSAELVGKANGKITGIVLNDIDLGDWAQNYYYGHYTYEYGTYPEANRNSLRG